MRNARVIFIAGPTASGKSAAALRLAEKIGGEIVNSDAMQVYKDLQILTARPQSDDESKIPHHLYGHLDATHSSSAGRWAEDAAAAIRSIIARQKRAILVGGTGLYFKALEEGLSPIPEIASEYRESAKARLAEIGAAAFKQEVIKKDPAMAHLPEGDAQRLVRAFEVYEATGQPLSHFQNLPRKPFIEEEIARVVVEPSRDALYRRCDARAAAMIESGGVEEVRRLLAQKLDPALPLMKALGVPEISAYLGGALDRDEALALLQQNTRRFAKRQLTWFRNQASGWPRAESGSDVLTVLDDGG